MIYDCILFAGEIECFDIRYNELKALNVQHIVVQANETFTGIKKSIQYLSYPNVTCIDVLDMPNNCTAWEREAYQRNSIMQGLKDADDEDIIIISDVDEIPRAIAVDYYNNEMSLTALTMDQFSYYVNCLQGIQNWTLPRIMPYKYLKTTTPDAVRRSGYPNQISNAGWHFGYLGGIKKIQDKFKSFSHTELNIDKYASDENLKRKLDTGESLWAEDQYWYFVKIGLSFPEYLYYNQEQFKNLIKQL